jgi:hypothetical protein
MLRKAILESQRDTFCQFLGKIDYRKDGAKAHSFFSKLCGKQQSNKTDVNVSLKYKNKEGQDESRSTLRTYSQFKQRKHQEAEDQEN